MNRQEMLHKVQMLGFVLVDVNLFLNTHPDHAAALSFYEKYNALYQQAVAEFETAYGPLSATGVNTEDGWTWINDPWPWEMEG